MGKNFQPNYSLYLQENTLSRLKLLSQASNLSMAQIINRVMADYVSKFLPELTELKHATQTATCKLKEKIFGEKVSQIKVKTIPTNSGTHIAATLGDTIISTVKISTADEKKATEFVKRVVATIGIKPYEITRRAENEKTIVVTADDETLSQTFDDAGTAEKVEAFIDEIFAQLTKQAFQNQGN